MVDEVTLLVAKPNEHPPAGSEYIVIAGQSWPVPKLALRQWRTVVPNILTLMRELGPMFIAALEAKDGVIDAVKLIMTFRLTTAQVDLLTDIVYQALTRAHKNMTRDMFDEMDSSLDDMMKALPVVMKQCGLFKKPGEAAAPPGELKAGSLTGTV